MSDVPSDLRREILLRLPAESLIRFRTVCKLWRHIIDDPWFVKTHTLKNKFSPTTLLLRTTTGDLYTLPMDSLNFTNGEHTVDLKLLECLVIDGGAPQPPCFPMSSCNGLILVLHFQPEDIIWVIWNPFTADFHQLPQLSFSLGELSGSGLGYDSASDDYKVVRINSVIIRNRLVYQTLVYSLRSNSWKKIKNCPFHFPWVTDGVYFNGSVHWISMHHLVSLDLATEEYSWVLLPPSRALPFDSRLDRLDGCLILSNSIKTECAWVMKDCCDGVDNNKTKKPWRKLFSSQEMSFVGKFKGCQWPVAYSKSQRELILQGNSNKIVLWDIEKYSAKELTIHGPLVFEYSQIFPVSLFRFKDFVGVGDGDGNKTAEVQINSDSRRTRMRCLVTTTDLQCLSPSHCSSFETNRESDQSGSGNYQYGSGSESRRADEIEIDNEEDE